MTSQSPDTAPFPGFGPLADALMAGLASRSHEWKRWELCELKAVSYSGTLGSKSSGPVESRPTRFVRVVVETRIGERRERVAGESTSPSRLLLELFDPAAPSAVPADLVALVLPAADALTATVPASTSEMPSPMASFQSERSRLQHLLGPIEAALRLELWSGAAKDSHGRYGRIAWERWELRLDEFVAHDGLDRPSTRSWHLA